MHRPFKAFVCAVALASCSEGADPSGVTTAAPVMVVAPAGGLLLHENTMLPLDQTVFDPCTSESVRITGDLHLLHRKSLDGKGVEHDVFHTNFTNVDALGLTSGNRYHATSAETSQSSFWVLQSPPRDFKSTHELTLHLIANTGSNLMVHGTFIVFRTNGVFDLKVVRMETTCHGAA